MADRPILFSGPMVRALLAGTKTQTRRILRPQPEQFPIDDKGTLCEVGVIHVEGDALPRIHHGRVITAQKLKCAVGDRLWVRENVTRFDRGSCDQWIWFQAGGNDMSGWIGRHFPDQGPDDKWSAPAGPAGGLPYSVPSIHMPRWASRLTLTVTDVRVERLQDISEADALAEGITKTEFTDRNEQFGVKVKDDEWCVGSSARTAYSVLWAYVNGEMDATTQSGSWFQNPWVAAYTFTVAKGNIDAQA